MGTKAAAGGATPSPRRDARAGDEGFRAFYSEAFGERWPGLEAALSGPADAVAFSVAEGAEPYYLDSASVFAASSLPLSPGSRVLDACAAPGGKSLVLASRLPDGARLEANELSSDRRRRLRDVLDRHVPEPLRRRIEVSGRDAAAMCRSFESSFDAILLDAPCSSERHVLADPSAMAQWRPARTRSLASRQWALLSSALIMLKPGGWLVYSTCALSPQENDGVAGRALRKLGDAIEIDRSLTSPRGEPTEYGVSILPDRAGGAGPMYVCRLHRLL